MIGLLLVLGRRIELLLQDWESWVLTVIRTERFFIFEIAKIWRIFFTSKFYFKKMKKTASIRQRNAARWFHCRPSPLNISVTITVNTVSEITSWMTFSCISVKGPPFPVKPILLAGTWAQYSKKASPQEKRITIITGQPDEIFISWSFRWPYQANVMNTFDAMRRRIVRIVFIWIIFCGRKNKIKFVKTTLLF